MVVVCGCLCMSLCVSVLYACDYTRKFVYLSALAHVFIRGRARDNGAGRMELFIRVRAYVYISKRIARVFVLACVFASALRCVFTRASFGAPSLCLRIR